MPQNWIGPRSWRGYLIRSWLETLTLKLERDQMPLHAPRSFLRLRLAPLLLVQPLRCSMSSDLAMCSGKEFVEPN